MGYGRLATVIVAVAALGVALGYAIQWYRVDTHMVPPDAVLPNAARYHGDTRDGVFHGQGVLVRPNGERYEGGFVDGLMAGEGHYEFPGGVVYDGEMADGMLHGEGRLETAAGEVYIGRFERGLMVEGIYRDGKGNEYEGAFEDWGFHGQGTYRAADGNIYRGRFRQGQFTGEGVHVAPDGTKYEGEFRKWRYHGRGTLTEPDGDRYVGQFRNGFRHGEGRLEYAASDRVRKGQWRWGSYQGDDGNAEATASSEDPGPAVERALYRQSELLSSALDELAAGRPGRIDLYFVGFAPYGRQDVFRKEIEAVAERMDQRYGTGARSVVLGNHPDTLEDRPMATATSLARTLERVGRVMDADEDILFLYMTSHGSRDHALAVEQPGFELPDLGPERVATMLDDAGVRWRVVGVSACYSGGFVPVLEGPRTLVMSASHAERAAYGCGDQSEMTYFGKALFREALPRAESFIEAFGDAREHIRRWEDDAGVERHARPQMAAGDAITDHLGRWRAGAQ